MSVVLDHILLPLSKLIAKQNVQIPRKNSSINTRRKKQILMFSLDIGQAFLSRWHIHPSHDFVILVHSIKEHYHPVRQGHRNSILRWAILDRENYTSA